MVACEQQTHFRSSPLSLPKTAIFRRERRDDRKRICCSQASRMGAVSLLLKICESAPAITRAASCVWSAGASTSKPGTTRCPLAHLEHSHYPARARSHRFSSKKKRQLTVYKDCKTYFFMLQFVTSSTKGSRFFTQSWCLRDVSFNLLFQRTAKKYKRLTNYWIGSGYFNHSSPAAWHFNQKVVFKIYVSGTAWLNKELMPTISARHSKGPGSSLGVVDLKDGDLGKT